MRFLSVHMRVTVAIVVAIVFASWVLITDKPRAHAAHKAIAGALISGDTLEDARLRLAQERGLPRSSVRIPRLRRGSVAPPHGSAPALLVIDVVSGTTLFEKNARTPLPLASLTKLASVAAVVHTPYRAAAPVTIRLEDVHPTPDAVSAGDVVRVHDLLTLSLVGSSNNATAALVRSVGFTEGSFAVFAGGQATLDGARSLHLVEPTGLHPENRGSAYDVASLLRRAVAHPVLLPLLAAPEGIVYISGEKKTVQSTNGILGGHVARIVDRVVAAKTGHIDESGYNFAMIAEEDGRELLVVVLGAADHFSRFTEAQALVRWAVDNFVWPS